MDRKVVNAWCLYDFGNSAFAVIFISIFATYFTGTVARGPRADLWWGLLGSTSMLAVALSSPFLGAVADKAGLRKRFLTIYTCLGAAAVLSWSLLGAGDLAAGFLLGVVANFCFEGAVVFYNSFLPELAPPTHQGRVSARGFWIGYAGSMAALALAAPLAHRGLFPAVWALLAVQWLVFARPALRHLPADERRPVRLLDVGLEGARNTVRTLKSVLGMRDLRRFLLAYFIYEDGVNTVIFFAMGYAQRTIGLSQLELGGVLMLINFCALVGSFAMGGPTDRRGPRWAVRLLLVWWTAVVTVSYFATSKTAFVVVAAMAGLGLGPIQAASRALMARLIPAGREAELFGFYALCGKSGAILGPTLFGLISSASGSQRPAVLSVAAFYALGFVLLGRVQVSPAAPCSSNGPR
ncbi:MAG: MFS transporter [Planctomycetota bacterium]